MPSKKRSQKTNIESPKPVIYLGPTVPGTSLERYKVFKGGLPENIKQIADKIPAVKRLIVDTKEMAEIERKIGDKTTVFAHAFAEIINHNKEVMKR